MGRVPENISLKRKRPEGKSPSQNHSDVERRIYDLIRSKKGMGIWTKDIRQETSLPENLVTKSIHSLLAKRLIKEVTDFQNKRKKHYMAVEFEPSHELTGGAWYVDGGLDMDFINVLRGLCLKHINKVKVATVEGILESIRKSGVLKNELTTQQITDIVQVLAWDNMIVEVTSTEMGDYADIPFGTVCYRSSTSKGYVGAMASIPCGVCPRIDECTPDGVISPSTCVYYTKWLDF